MSNCNSNADIFMPMQTRENYKEESAQSHTVSKGLDEYTGMYIGDHIAFVLQFLYNS